MTIRLIQSDDLPIFGNYAIPAPAAAQAAPEAPTAEQLVMFDMPEPAAPEPVDLGVEGLPLFGENEASK